MAKRGPFAAQDLRQDARATEKSRLEAGATKNRGDD